MHPSMQQRVDGLAAMRPLRPFAHGWLWRPLLDLPRGTRLPAQDWSLFDSAVLMAAGDRVIAAPLQHWLDEHHAQLRWTPGAA
mgnify:CR=1 FL=1